MGYKARGAAARRPGATAPLEKIARELVLEVQEAAAIEAAEERAAAEKLRADLDRLYAELTSSPVPSVPLKRATWAFDLAYVSYVLQLVPGRDEAARALQISSTSLKDRLRRIPPSQRLSRPRRRPAFSRRIRNAALLAARRLVEIAVKEVVPEIRGEPPRPRG